MKIVAIGGGEIGRNGSSIETEEIDREIIKLSEKKHPRVLFLPPTSSHSEEYWKVFQKYYGQKLGCQVDVLYLSKDNSSTEKIRAAILDTDIIYVGGGDTNKMLDIWRTHKIDKFLEEAGKKGIILSGLSAGAYCWFEKAISSSKEAIYTGIGLIKKISNVCHYPQDEKNKEIIFKNVNNITIPVIALENCSALEIANNQYRIITSSKKAHAYLLHRHNGKVVEEELPNDKKFRPLEELFQR